MKTSVKIPLSAKRFVCSPYYVALYPYLCVIVLWRTRVDIFLFASCARSCVLVISFLADDVNFCFWGRIYTMREAFFKIPRKKRKNKITHSNSTNHAYSLLLSVFNADFKAGSNAGAQGMHKITTIVRIPKKIMTQNINT